MPNLYFRTQDEPGCEKSRAVVHQVCKTLGLDIFLLSEDCPWQFCIENAAFMIADISAPKNEKGDLAYVMLETGYAWRSQKTVFFIGQKNSPKLGQNILLYDPEDMKIFRAKLTAGLVMLCRQQKIRYNKFPNMPQKFPDAHLPILPQENMRIQNHVAIGDNCIDQLRYHEACEEYTRAISYIEDNVEFQPHHAYIFFKKAFACKKINNIEQALENYQESIKLKPDYADAYIALGITLYERKDYGQALQNFQKAAELKPDFTRTYVFSGLMYRLTGDYENAIFQLNKAIELNPEFLEAFYNRGLVYVDMQQFDQALEDFGKTIELNDKYTNAYIKRGLVYMELRNYDLAIENFKHAVTLRPNNVEAYKFLGEALFEKGYKEFYELAISNWQKAIELGSPDSQFLEEKIKAISKNI